MGIGVDEVITCVLAAVAVTLALVFILSKCFFLARWRIGWLMMFANVLYETAYKKYRWSRFQVDAVMLPVVALLASLAGGGWAGGATAVAMGLTWAAALTVDLCWRSGVLATQHRGLVGRVPLPLPRLVVVIRGPLLARGRIGDLGTWPVGHVGELEVLVLNPSPVVPQLPLDIEVRSGSSAVSVEPATRRLACPGPGELVIAPVLLRAVAKGTRAEIVIRVVHGDRAEVRRLRVQAVVDAGDLKPRAAGVRRWKGGAGAAFAWRGDQDLYDPATFQSEAGLRVALGLARRFRIPSTLFLSGRLSLDQEAHEAFCRQFRWDRRSNEIPDFVRFLREEVTIDPVLEFPVTTGRELAVEIGNHMFIHLGTHAAADPGNQWKSHAWIGEGSYPWHHGEPGDSFTEQRDNALANSRLIKEVLGVKVTSWGVPGRVYDENTPRAVEAAGLEVGTDTNASAFTNVLRLVPPHHPAGCERLVEITKKYPGDPDNAYKLAMLKYWLHAARRSNGAFLFMAHHHLLLYQGSSCYHITEEFLRHVLGDCDGDFYVGTVTALGRYWRDVLSPRTRVVEARLEDGEVLLSNAGQHDLKGLPVEIQLANGGSFMVLADVRAGETTTIWKEDIRPSPGAGHAS